MESLDMQIKDKLQKVCICKAITRATIKQCIRDGNQTVEAVREATGATTGGCHGNRCREKIENLIETYKTEWE